MCVPLFTHCFPVKSACDYQGSVKGRTRWVQPTVTGSIRNQGVVFLTSLLYKHREGCWSCPQGWQCDVALSPNLLNFPSSLLSSLPSLSIPLSFFNTTHMEAMRARWARRDGFTAKETSSPKHVGSFVLETHGSTVMPLLQTLPWMGHALWLIITVKKHIRWGWLFSNPLGARWGVIAAWKCA